MINTPGERAGARIGRFREVAAPDHRGEAVVKLLPAAAVPALAQVGMAVSDSATGACGVIVLMTGQLCLYQTPEGHQQAATWHTVSLEAVRPDPRQV